MSEAIITLLTIFLIVLAITWIILPFLVVGINNRLDKVIHLLQVQQGGEPQPVTVEETEQEDELRELTEEEKAERSRKNKADALKLGVVLAVLALVAVIMRYFG